VLQQTGLGRSSTPSVSAIAEFSAIRSLLLTFNALAANPLQDVWGAIPQFDFLVLAIAQKANRRKIDQGNLGQVEKDERGVILNALAKFFKTLIADSAD
jgi:hypothetical protein